MITNEIYFFKNQSSVSTSGPLYNVNDGTLILQVDGNVSNLELLVLGNTDLIDDNFVTLKTINASNYNMSDKITSTGIYWIDINGIRKIKLNLNKITGSVSVKAITKRGLTTDLVARAMAANSASGGITLDDVEAITGELANLNTKDKSNLVNAINEVANSGESIYEIRPKDLHLIDYMDTALVGEQITRMFTDGVEDPILRVRPTDVARANITYYDFKLGRTDYPFSKKTQYYFMINPIIGISGAPIQVWNTYLKIAYIYISGSWDSDNKFTCNTIRCNTMFNETVENITTDNKVLTKTNTNAFTPTENYHPATKKYVDDTISAKGGDKLHDYNIYTITLDDYNLQGTFPTITDTTTLAKFDEILTDIYKKRIAANATHDNAFLIVYSSSDTFIFRISTIQASYCYLYGTYIEEPIDHNGYTRSYQFYITGTLDTTAQTFKTTKVKFNDNSKRVLLANNTLSYNPTGDYNPATKKYVDDQVATKDETSLIFEWDGKSSSTNIDNIALFQNVVDSIKDGKKVLIYNPIDGTSKLNDFPHIYVPANGDTITEETTSLYFKSGFYDLESSNPVRGLSELVRKGKRVEVTLSNYTVTNVDAAYDYSYIVQSENASKFIPIQAGLSDTTYFTPTYKSQPASKGYVDDAITTAITTTLGGSY